MSILGAKIQMYLYENYRMKINDDVFKLYHETF